MKIIKIFLGMLLLMIVAPIVVIRVLWMFCIELPWVTSTPIIEGLVIKLNEWVNPSSKEKPEIEPNPLETINEFVDRKIKSEKKSKFQERLDKAMEAVKKSKND